MQSHQTLFAKNCFPAIFDSRLAILHKTQNAFISETVQDKATLTKFLALLQESSFLPFFADRLNLCINGNTC